MWFGCCDGIGTDPIPTNVVSCFANHWDNSVLLKGGVSNHTITEAMSEPPSQTTWTYTLVAGAISFRQILCSFGA